MVIDRWRLPRYSKALKAGNYYSKQCPMDAHWGVRVIIPIDSRQVVLVQHDRKGRDPFWLFPGGGIKPGETISDAGIREVREETGLDVVIDSLVYIREALPNELEFYLLSSQFSGDIKLGSDPEFAPDDQVLMNVGIIDLDEITQFDLFTLYPRTIQERLEQDWLNGWPKALYIEAAQ